jgi:FlaG/FlaF family flagellin (archaellin)
MKRLLTISAALLTGIFTVAITSCGSNHSIAVYPNSMTATVGGVIAFNASGTDINVSKTNGTLNISAVGTSRSKITLTVPSFSNAIGTVSINNIGLPAGASFDSVGNGANILLPTRGSITFTNVSAYIQGTYSFVCTDSTTITSGSFKVKAP